MNGTHFYQSSGKFLSQRSNITIEIYAGLAGIAIKKHNKIKFRNHSYHSIYCNKHNLKISLKKLYRTLRYLGRRVKNLILRKRQKTKQINKISNNIILKT